MPIKSTLESMQELALKQGGECLSLSYTDNKTPLDWICSKGHHFQSIPNRIQQGYWCPECSERKKYTLEGMRQLATSRGGRCLSNEFANGMDHLEWECEKGHRWKALAYAVMRGRWCLACSGVKKKTLEDMHKMASSKGGRCLSKEYINTGTPLEWECDKGHRWEASPHGVSKGSWCPYCRVGKYSAEDISAHIKNMSAILDKRSKNYTKLVAEWHSTRNGNLRPENFGPGSKTKIWWTCSVCNRDFQQLISTRTLSGRFGCETCRRKSVRTAERNQIIGDGGALSRYEDICAEWHPSKNGDLRPEMCTDRTGRMVWWLCPFGHSYRGSIYNRTQKHSGCQICGGKSSKTEIRVLSEFMAVFDGIEWLKKIDKVEADISCGKYKFVVEVDGRHHEKKQKRDIQKTEHFEARGYLVVRIRDKRLPKIAGNCFYSGASSTTELKQAIHDAIKFIAKERGIDLRISSGWQGEAIFKDLLRRFPGPTAQQSLGGLRPHLIEYWSMDNSMDIHQVWPHSNATCLWNCSKCGARLSRKAAKVFASCIDAGPMCRTCSFSHQAVRKMEQAGLHRETLASRMPSLVPEWHPENKYQPGEVSYGSNYSATWRCKVNSDHVWTMPVKQRTNGIGCPICAGRRVDDSNSLSACHPNVAREWHPTLNDKSPLEVSRGSSYVAFWRCSKCNHEWRSTVANRTSTQGRQGCPACAKKWVDPKFVERAVQMRAQGITLKKVQETLGISISTILRAAKKAKSKKEL